MSVTRRYPICTVSQPTNRSAGPPPAGQIFDIFLSVPRRNFSNMSSVGTALDALDDVALERLGAADVRELSAPERFGAG